MAITPFTGSLGTKPLTQITPFTYRDGLTFLQILNEFEKWLNRIGIDLNEQLLSYLKDIQATKDKWEELFNQFIEDVTINLEGLNDQATANLVRNGASKLRGALNETFAAKTTQTTVESGRLSDAKLKETFVGVNALVRDVRDWGAKPSRTISYHEQINAALRGGNCSVYFPEGEWLIQGTLRLYKNTEVVLHPNAVLLNDNPETEYVFINGELNNRNYARAYAGDGNISISGGTIDNSPKANKSVYVSAMAFAHAENIHVSSMTVKNNYRSHFMEFNSIRHGSITNCRFINLNPDGMTNREAINIDYAYETGFPAFGAYDNTPCEDITVSGCEFVDVNDGVGSHAWAESLDRSVQHKNIKVINNTFRNLSGTAVHTNNWIESEISGNTMKNIDYRGIYLQRAFRCLVVNNKIIDSGMISSGVETVVFLGSGSSDNFLSSNTIFNLTPNMYHSPYRINDGTGNIIDTSGAAVGTNGTTVGNIPPLNTVDGSTRYRLENNQSVKIPVNGQSKQGLTAVSCQSAASNSIRGIYWIRCDANPAIATAAQVTADSVDTTTGALTGTTGAAGKNTLSAGNDGSIYIENRSGDPKFYDVRFITL